MKRTSLLLSLIVGTCLPLFAQDKEPVPAPDPAKPNPDATVEIKPLAPPANKADARPEPKPAERNIRFQFDGIPYADVLERFAQMADKPLVADSKPEGNLTFHDSKPYNFGEALDTLNVILATKGFVMVEDDHYLRLTPLNELSRVPLKILQGSQDAKATRPEEVVTVVLTLKNLQAPEVATSVTNMLTRAGSVAPLSRGRGLILTDRLANIKRIESLIETVDNEAILERQMKSYTLAHASGAVLQDLLSRTFGKVSAPKKVHFNPATKRTEMLDPDPSTYITAVYDDASRTMILFGPQDRMEMAEELINEFEDKEGGAGEVRIYYPVAKKPTELAEMLRQALPGIAASGESAASAATKARLIIDETENRLIVAAPLAQQADQIEEIVNSLDRPVHGKQGGKGGRARREVVQLTKVFEIRKMEISKVEALLEQVLTKAFPQGGHGITTKITVEPNSKTVVVTGSPEDVRKAEDIIEQLDGKRRMAAPRNLKIFPLEHARAEAILENANSLIVERMNDPRFEREIAPSVIADEKNNRLLVTATEAQLEAVGEVIATLDIAPAKPKRAMSMLPVKSKTPEEMIALVSELVAQLGEDQADAAMAPRLFPDAASRQIIVLAAADDAEKITALVRQLDASGSRGVTKETRGIELFGRKAEELTPLVQQLYQEQVSGVEVPDGGAATLLAESRDNRILVTGTEAEIKRVEAIVRQLDPEGSAPKTEETRVFALKSALATDLSAVVEQAVVAKAPNARILTDSRSNSLIVTGDAGAIDAADKLIQQLDKRPRLEPREMKVIDLNNADAASLAEMVGTVGAEMIADQKGADYAPQTRVVPDAVGGRLILSGPRDELVIYESVVERLDKAGDSRGGARVFQLQNNDAEQVAQILSKTMVTNDGRGRGTLRIGISTDKNSNSIVVTGDRQDLIDVESIIQRLDGGGTRGAGGATAGSSGRGLKVFEVADGNASNLAALAQSVFESQNANRPGVGQVSFTAGPGGKKLIVMAPSGLLEQVETVVNLLNTRPATTKRSLQRIETAGQGGSEVVTTVKEIYAEQSAKQPGPAASIYADPSGSGLMVFGSDAQIEQVRQIVATLSTAPSPKRETQVFEVGNSADVQRLQPLVEQLYSDQWKDKAGADPADAQILADTRMGRLIVTGKPEHVKEIAAIIGQLGVSERKPAGGRRQTKVFKLNGGDAGDIQGLVEKLYEDQARERFGSEKPDTLILADDDNNRLVVSGDEAEVKSVSDIIETLQLDATEGGSAKIFVIKHADPQSVARIVSMAVSGEDTSNSFMRYYRFSRYRPSNAPKQFNASADASTRTVIVSGEPKDVLAAASIIEQLDQPTDAAPRKMRVIEVGPGEANEVAQQVRSLFEDQARTRPGLRENDILVMDGSNGDRIIVSGNDEQLAVVDEIVKTISPEEAPAVARETKVYDIKAGDADDIGDVVRDLYAKQLKSRKTRPEAEALILDDRSTNRLIVSAIPEEMKAIDSIITQLDKASPREDTVRFFKLKNANPDDVASILHRVIVRYNSRGTALPQVTATADGTTDTLIVTGAPDDLTLAAKLIEDYDRDVKAPDGAPRRMKVVNVGYGQAKGMVEQVRSLFEDQTQSRPELRRNDILMMEGADGDQIVIAGNDEQLKIVDEIIKTVAPEEGAKTVQKETRVYDIMNGDADDIGDIVKDLYRAKLKKRKTRPESQALILDDRSTNRLLVSAIPEEMKEIDALIAQLDKARPRDDAVRFVKLKNADPDNMRSILASAIVRYNSRGIPVPKVTATVDRASGTLILSGDQKDLERAEKLIAEYDGADIPREERVTRFVKTHDADPDEIARQLSQLYQADMRQRGKRDQADAVFMGNDDANRVIITARESDMKFIDDALAKLLEGWGDAERRVQMFTLKHVPATPVADMVKQLFDRRYSRSRNAARLTITPGPDDKTLLVDADGATLKRVADFVGTVDKPQGDGDAIIQTVHLEEGESEAIARALMETINAEGANPELKSVHVTPVSGAKTILLNGPRESVDKVMEIVKMLDAGSVGGEAEVRIYQLKNTTARDIEPILAQLIKNLMSKGSSSSDSRNSRNRYYPFYGYYPYSMRSGNQESTGKQPSITIHEETNRLLITAKPEQFELIEKLLPELDKAPESSDKDVQFVWLKTADGYDIIDAVDAFYADRAKRDQPYLETDLFGEQLTIIAKRSDMPQIMDLVEQFDKGIVEIDQQIRMISLSRVPVEQMAEMLKTLYPQMYSGKLTFVERLDAGYAPEDSKEDKPGSDKTDKTDKKDAKNKTKTEDEKEDEDDSDTPEVVISIDKKTNMLILSGPSNELDKVDDIIFELEWFALPGDTDLHVYPLKKADPAVVAKTLNDLFQFEARALAAQQAKPKTGANASQPNNNNAQRNQQRAAKPPKMIVVPEPRTRSIIVRATPTDYLTVESLIEKLDQAGEQSKIAYRLIPLKNAPAAKLAPMVTIMAKQMKAAQPGDALVIEPYDRNRSLLVIGRDVVIDEIETMIQDLDIPATDEGVEVVKVELKHADAATVASTLSDIFSRGSRLTPRAKGEPELGSGKALTKPFNVAADSRLNTVFLSGAKEAVALAQEIVADMDRRQEGFLTEVKLIQLRYASAGKVLPLLQAVFAERNSVPGAEGISTFVTRLKTADKEGRNLTSDQPKSRAAMVLQADEALNILVIAARSDALPLIEAVVKQLDIPEASGLASVRIYPLEHADAASVRSIIAEVYDGSLAGSNRTADKPNVMVDQRSNSLVVAGTDASFAMIDSLLAMLDTELSLELRDIHILPLEHADANELASTIQNLMDSRITRIGGGKRGAAEAHRVLIVPEARSNSLLIAGGKDSFELVESLARRLDAAAPALSGTIRLLPLNFADARTVASSFDSLFTARYAATGGTKRNRNKPVIVADARINALLITAAMDDNEIIDELLPKLDRKLDNPSLLLTVVPLKHNDAAQVANMLEDIFDARLKSRAVPGQTPSPSEEVSIEVDSLNNTLIVSSNKENLETINDLLKQVDVQPMMAEGVFETFVLEHADAQRVATLIQSLIQQGLYRPGRAVTGRSRSRSSRSAGEALAVAVDPRSNTLIVSASPENLGVVKEVIRQVDTKDFAQGGDIRFYKLENAQASDIAVTLNTFFEAKRAADTVAINAPERGIPVSIIPDDRINTLLVTGSKEAFDTLDRILPDLDGEDQISRQNFKVIPLQNATATALRDTLEQLFANRPPPVKGQRPDPITLVADAWVNALIVGARVHDMTMVESMIGKLDSEQAELGVKVEVIPVLKANVERIAETVQELYRASSSRASGLPVFVNADERLNALVVSGGETDLKRIKEVVRKLDTDEVSRVNEIRVIPLEYARADSLATILSSALNDKPDSLEGGNDDSQALLQFVTSTDEGETFVTSALHEAVLITPDTRMNSLIVSGPVDYMGLLERIVKRLDDASPRQAQIKVFSLKNTEARQVGQLLLGLFRLTPSGAPAAGNDRSVEYTLFQPTVNGEQAVASAVVGAEEQSALRISIDTRSNSILVGGSEHYIGLVSEVIESLDQGGGVARKSQVYRLKNAQAADVSTAIRDFLDQDRQRITQVLGQDAVRTAEALLEKEVAIVAEPVSNTLLLSAHAHYFESLNTMIEELDRAQPQVLVQVLLAEITVDAMRDLGVEWNYTKTLGNGWDFGTGTDFGVPAELASLGGYSALVTGNNFNFLLRALENDGHLEVLSRPQILTADNQPASINIGQRVPLITGSQITPQGGVNNQFDYRDVGVSLAVTPRIVGDGFVQIDVQTTNSSISSSTVQINADATVPIINERRASTMVSVQSGQTVVIGGLISASEDSREKKMPLLGSIPVLGNLFKSSKNVSDRKELLVLLTPQILTAAPEDKWSQDINSFSDDMIRESSMKNVFKDDEKKRAMFERVFPTDVKPEDGNVKPKMPKEEVKPPGE